MELYVKMTDKEYEEYQDYIKHKEEYVKKSEVSLNDIIKRDFDYVSTNYNPVCSAQEYFFRHKTKREDINVRLFDVNKGVSRDDM